MTRTPPLLCAACRVEVASCDPGRTDVAQVRCPGCGLTDTREIAEREAEAGLQEAGENMVQRLDRCSPALPGVRSSRLARARFVFRI